MKTTIKPLATILCASVVLSGCQVISAAQNAKAGFQGYKSLQMAKAIEEAPAVFEGVDHIRVDADLIARSEQRDAELETAFIQLIGEALVDSGAAANVNLELCSSNCPEDTLQIRFQEQERENVLTKLAAGGKIVGDLQYAQNGSLVDRIELDMADSYAETAQMIVNASSARLMATEYNRMQREYDDGELAEDTFREQMEGMTQGMNQAAKLNGPLFELLQSEG